MTKKEFKYAMQRGLGRCIVELKNTKEKEKYRDLVLWACGHELAYDVQSEGTRSVYLYTMIQQYPDASSFLQAVVESMNKKICSNGWVFATNCDVLSLFAGDGNKNAYDELVKCYKKLFPMLIKKRRVRGVFTERDNFEYLCVALISSCHEIAISRKIYLKIVTDLGILFTKNPLCDYRDFMWFQAVCEERIGKRSVYKILKENERHSKEVKAYFDSMREEDWENHSETRLGQTFMETAAEIYEVLQSEQELGRRLPLNLMRRMQIKGKQAEVEKMADFYKDEKDDKLRCEILRLMANQYCASVLDVSCLIEDSKSDNEDLSEYAFRAMGYIKSEEVHDYAIQIVQDKRHISDVISILTQNYKESDKELLVELVKSLPITYEDGEWHSAFLAIQDMFRDKTIKKPPKELLLYLYENTLCAFCREGVVKEMGRRRMLTKEMLYECCFDSNNEISEYAQRKID